MWQTQTSNHFYLEGKNAQFYVELSQSLADEITCLGTDLDESDEYSINLTGCVIFDNATIKQKIFLLNFALKHLLSSSLIAPNPTHILEAAAYFPFAYLEAQIQYEIERQLEETINVEEGKYKEDYFKDYFFITFNRRKTYEIYKFNILSFNIAYDIIEPDAFGECETLEEWQEYYQKTLEFSPESTDEKEWNYVINQLAHNLVLGDDEDFMTSSYNPQIVDGISWVEECMGISKKYFSNLLPKVTDEEYKKALNEIFNYKI